MVSSTQAHHDNSASGSGRRPAHWNGCYSMRPSHGILPVDGYTPSFRWLCCHYLEAKYLTSGFTTGDSMYPAFMAEILRNAEHSRVTGTEIDCLKYPRWVRDAQRSRLFLMLHIATAFNHLSFGLHAFNHEQRSNEDH